MITLCIRYTLEARKRSDFERYARVVTKSIPRCGGELVGYWLPTKFAGPTNVGLALINFPDLAAYEQYRQRLHHRRGPRIPRAGVAGPGGQVCRRRLTLILVAFSAARRFQRAASNRI